MKFPRQNVINTIRIWPKIVIICSISFCYNCAMAGRTHSRTPRRTRPPPIQVCIHDLSGSLLCDVNMPKKSLVLRLGGEIQDVEGTEIPLQKLLLDGRVLDINRRLTTYGVQERADITLMRLQKPPGCYNCYNRRCRERHWTSWYCTICKQPRYCETETYWGLVEDSDVLYSNSFCEECFNKRKPLH